MTEATNPEGSRGPLTPYEAGKGFGALLQEMDSRDEPEPDEVEASEDEQDLPSDEELDEVESADSEEDEVEDISDDEDAEPESEDHSDDLNLTLTVNGEETVVEGEDEIRSLAQKGMHYTQEMQALREEQRKWEGDREEITASLEAKQSQYDSALETLEETFGAVLGDIDMTSPEIQKLKQEQPQQYLQLREQMDQLQAIKAERERIAREQQEKQREEFQQWVKGQKEKLEEKKPEWNDPNKRQQDWGAIREYAISRGLTDEELNNLYDHRFFLVLHDAARYQQAQATGKSAKPAKTKTKTAKPGSGKNMSAKGRKARKRRDRLAETGDVNEAGALLQELMTSKR